MRAIRWHELGASPVLVDDAPAPRGGPDQVLVRVHASSVNPVDNAIAAGMLAEMVPHEFPVTIGRDFAGVVAQVGADVTRVSTGDAVLGFVPAMGPAVHAGSWAELIAVPESGLAVVPDGVDMAIAGAAPLAAVTAMLCLDALELAEGDTLLIVGAAGGVGSIAIQLASAGGATVIAPGLAEDEDYLRGLGVSEVLPRDDQVVGAVLERYPDGVDAQLVALSLAPGTYDPALKAGGRVSSPSGAAGEGAGRTDVMAAPTRAYLDRIARLLGDGALTVQLQQTYELDRADEALGALAARHTQGKLGLHVG